MNEHLEFVAAVAVVLLIAGGMFGVFYGAIGLVFGTADYRVLVGSTAFTLLGWMLGRMMKDRMDDDDGETAGQEHQDR